MHYIHLFSSSAIRRYPSERSFRCKKAGVSPVKNFAQTAAAAEESVTKQVTGFDTYVLAAKEAIGQARQDAVGVVSSQGDTSVKEVQAAQSKAQEAIEQDKTAALQDIESTKAAVVGAVEGAGTEATQEIAQEKKEALEAVTTAQASAVKV